MAYFSLKDIINEFSQEYYDPRDPWAKRQYEENKRKQNFSFGIVTDNQDPDSLGRIKVSLPMVANDYISKWIWVCQSYATGDAGVAVLPDLDDQVLVAFIGGDINQPVCIGSMYTPRHRPPIADNTDNNIKAIKTGATYLIMDDTDSAERMEASVLDGQIRVVIDTDGIHLTNELGPINITCATLTISDTASDWLTTADTTITAGGDISITTTSNAGFTSAGDITVTGSTIDLDGSSGVTAEESQIAIENDSVVGTDLHNIQVTTSSGTSTLTNISHPYVGVLNDVLSADVNVNGSAAATEGSKSEYTSPGHLPTSPGISFTTTPDNLGEVTGECIDSVTINGCAAAVLGSTVTTCDDGGSTDQCSIVAAGSTVTFDITYPGQDTEQYSQDGGLTLSTSTTTVYTSDDTAYADSDKSLSSLEWSETEVEQGTEVTLSCTCTGVRDGAGVIFAIYPDGADTDTDAPIKKMRAENESGSAEVTWFARDIREADSTSDMNWFFTAWTLYCDKETSGNMQVVNPFKYLVLNNDSEALSSKSYVITYPDGTEVTGTTDGDGYIDLDDLIPGNITVEVEE
jgi:type VI secretion system secreted protein VgrG